MLDAYGVNPEDAGGDDGLSMTVGADGLTTEESNAKRPGRPATVSSARRPHDDCGDGGAALGSGGTLGTGTVSAVDADSEGVAGNGGIGVGTSSSVRRDSDISAGGKGGGTGGRGPRRDGGVRERGRGGCDGRASDRPRSEGGSESVVTCRPGDRPPSLSILI